MWVGHAINHSLPSGAEVKNEWRCTSTPPVCLHGMDKDVFFLNRYCIYFILNILKRKENNGLSAYATLVVSPHCDMCWDDNINS
jgi:hypothetical protein